MAETKPLFNKELLLSDQVQDILNKILIKVEDIHSDKTCSPRTKIESRTDAAVNNTQLVLRHLDFFEKKLTRREDNLEEALQRVEEDIKDMIRRVEKDIISLKMDIKNLRDELFSDQL